MLSCSIWFSAPSFWMGGGLEGRCVGRVYGADGAVRHHVKAMCRILRINYRIAHLLVLHETLLRHIARDKQYKRHLFAL
jgi:hypothetical protein